MQHAPVPRDRVFFGLVLDDFVVMERVARAAFLSGNLQSCMSSKIMDKVRTAYTAAKLPRHPDKAFELRPHADFWGISFDGLTGLVRGAPSRVAPLAHLTCQIVKLGCCTVGLLQAVAGGWVSVMLLSRRTLSLLDCIYRAQQGRGQRAVLRLAPSLSEELLTCVILAPLMQCDLRTPF